MRRHLHTTALLITLTALPLVGQAADPSLQGFIAGTNNFINAILIPAVLAIAFLVFTVNVVRFFIIGGTSEEGQKKAKALALYSVGAFVFILSFWGIVNLLTESSGLDNEPCSNFSTSDYIIRDETPCTSPVPPPRPDQPEPTPTPEPEPAPEPTPTPEPTPEPEPGMETLEFLLQRERAIRQSAAGYLNDLEDIFGANTAVLNSSGLFVDFISNERTGSHDDADRLQAAYRLYTLDQITAAQLANYRTAINAYRTETIGPSATISQSVMQDIAIPQSSWPGGYLANHQSVADGVRAELLAFNERTSALPNSRLSDADIDTLVRNSTDFSVSYANRLDRLDQLRGDNANNTVYILDSDDSLYNAFINDHNTQRLLSGEDVSSIF